MIRSGLVGLGWTRSDLLGFGWTHLDWSDGVWVMDAGLMAEVASKGGFTR